MKPNTITSWSIIKVVDLQRQNTVRRAFTTSRNIGGHIRNAVHTHCSRQELNTVVKIDYSFKVRYVVVPLSKRRDTWTLVPWPSPFHLPSSYYCYSRLWRAIRPVKSLLLIPHSSLHISQYAPSTCHTHTNHHNPLSLCLWSVNVISVLGIRKGLIG